MNKPISFTEEEINGLFGSLAAEDESDARFKSFFLKNDTYEKIHNNMPLRILVAHKGIGKSAILRMSYLENKGKDILCLWVKPDDIADLGNDEANESMLELIRKWKTGLSKRIVELVLNNLNLDFDSEVINKGFKITAKILDTLISFFKEARKNLDLDLPRQAILNKYIENKQIVIYIDDLDRAWEGSKSNINRIAALLNAIRDMSNSSVGLLFRITLRSDVYYLVRTADESTDKIEGNVLWLKWTEHQLLVLLAKRVQSYFNINLSEKDLLAQSQLDIAKHLYGIMEERFEGAGKWEQKPVHYIILSLIRRRPRDLINLCTLAGRNASEKKHVKINTDDWQSIFDQYSSSRLQDTINEHRYELPDIERLLLGMKPNRKVKRLSGSFLYDTNQLTAKINGIMQGFEFRFSNGKTATSMDLLAFMYKINFLVGRKDSGVGYLDRKYFEDNQYLSTSYADFGYKWEVHPAFRWALYPESRNIFSDFD